MMPDANSIRELSVPHILLRTAMPEGVFLWILIAILLTVGFIALSYYFLGRPKPPPTPATVSKKESFLRALASLDTESADFADHSWHAFCKLLESYGYLHHDPSLTPGEVSRILGKRIPDGFSEYVAYRKYARKDAHTIPEENRKLFSLLASIAEQLEITK